MNGNSTVKLVTAANTDPKALDLALERERCPWIPQRKMENPMVPQTVTRNFPPSRTTSRPPKARDVQDVAVSFTTPIKYSPTAAHGTKAASNAPFVTESLTPG